MATTRARGNHAELAALAHLKANGCRLITSNYNIKAGEIDLIVDDSGVLVFVEVRFRNETTHGTGAETVTASKIRKLIRTARHFLVTHKQYQILPCRFDVISMSSQSVTPENRSRKYLIDWIKRAFTLDA
jgi:putative endonuclease